MFDERFSHAAVLLLLMQTLTDYRTNITRLYILGPTRTQP